MEINILTGKNITEYAFLKNKSEIILTPNMVFISEDLRKEDDGYFHLKLTQKAEDGTGNGKRQKKERRQSKKYSQKKIRPKSCNLNSTKLLI